MKNIIISVFILFFACSAFADHEDVFNALKAQYPLGGFSVISGNNTDDVKFHADFIEHGYIVPTAAQISSIIVAYQAIDNVMARRLAEIKQQSVERFKGYELYADMQSVIDYKAALRAVPTTAATEIAVLPDVASVKNYQPTWPAKPNL